MLSTMYKAFKNIMEIPRKYVPEHKIDTYPINSLTGNLIHNNINSILIFLDIKIILSEILDSMGSTHFSLIIYSVRIYKLI